MKTTTSLSGRKVTAFILGLYLVLSLSTLFTARPQVDESLHANPGYNLLYNGRMAATLYEMRGYLPLSSTQRTYYYPPLFFLATALWYRIAGFGLVQLRLLSVLSGLLALYCWNVIARSLLESTTAAWIVTSMVAVDYFFVLGAGQGRMDMMCAGLGIAAIAVYVSRRKDSFKSAIFWSYGLATMAALTHQAGLTYCLCLVFVTLYLDWRLISPKIVLLAAVPCLIGGLGWGAYIAQDPKAFLDQMRGTMTIGEQAFQAGHWSSIHVIANLQKELVFRYAGPFGLMPGVSLFQRLKALVLLAYIVGIVGALWMSTRRPVLLVFPGLAIISFLYLALASPSKFSYYLPHTTMFMAACFAVFISQLEFSGRARKWMLAAAVLVVAAIEISGLLYRVYQDPYRRSFLPAVAAVEQHSAHGALVIGSGELWFQLQAERWVLHDPSVGFRNGLKPAIFVMDPLYDELHEQEHQKHSAMYTYVQGYLDSWHMVYGDGYYRVYVPPRNSARGAAVALLVRYFESADLFQVTYKTCAMAYPEKMATFTPRAESSQVYGAAAAVPAPRGSPLAFYSAAILIFNHFARPFETILVGYRIPAILCTIGIVVVLLSGGLKELRSRVGIAVMLWVGWMCVSAPFSYWRGGTFVNVLSFAQFYLPLMLLVAVASKTPKDILKLCAVLTFACLCHLTLHETPNGADESGRYSLHGTFGNPDDVALLAGFTIPFFVLLATRIKNPVVSYLLLIGGWSYLLVVIGRTATRAAIPALIAMLGVYFIRGKGVQKMAIAVSAVVGMMFLLLVLPENAIKRLSTVLDAFNPKPHWGILTEADASAIQRHELMRDAIITTLQHPIVGVGSGMFTQYRWDKMLEPNGQRKAYLPTHNTYLEISSECGIPGLIFYLIFLSSIYLQIRAVRKSIVAYKADQADQVRAIAVCVEAALVYFAVCAAFMTCDKHPHQFVLAGIAIALPRIVYSLAGLPMATTVAHPTMAAVPFVGKRPYPVGAR